jgi:hypothetical protein
MDQMYEKLGAFYLGRVYDLTSRQLKEDLILYDSKDLTTHAVIIGMTGSGKTGLGIGLMEEALIDNIPVIAIDPKGDLPNLLLNFPQLRPEDFRPWINEQDALNKGLTPEKYAENQAGMWRKGLASWGQQPDRIARLRSAADFNVYTPGSSAGSPVSVLRNFAPPSSSILNDPDLLRERIETTATSLLVLLGIEADPITSREHILLSNIFEFFWSEGKSLDLGGLIHFIQAPPFGRIGVMDLDLFFPAKERFALAMRINNLLAAPGFEAWMAGEALDIGRMLHTDQGMPRVSIFTISHLADAQRMFFVSMLLNEILGWMRSQSGTSSLRAILYMDEVFGYLPPVSNPPSKRPLLTLMKQARAFGLGVVLSTQNPVDLDYKGLSNTGTWFIGRLQTERDKERVLAGLEGVAAGSGFDRSRMEEILAGLGERVFLLHNVHENEPVIFHTRWVLSYLHGPMTREQIKTLTAAKKTPAISAKPIPAAEETAGEPISPKPPRIATLPPVMPPGIETFYLTGSGAGHGLVYYPGVIGQVDIHYFSSGHQIDVTESLALAVEFQDMPSILDWNQAMEFNPANLETSPAPGADFVPLPAAAMKAGAYRKWNKDFLRWVSGNRPLVLYRSRRLGMTGRPGESEGEFRVRFSQAIREKRDLEVEKLRSKYRSRFTTLRNRMMRAEQAVSRETDQAKSSKIQTAVSFGTAIIGALLGRKTISATSASRIGTAMKSASRIRKEQMDIDRARETSESLKDQLVELDKQLQSDIERIEASFDPGREELEKISIKPRRTEMTLGLFGLAWMPYRKDAGGRLSPDWR